MKGGLLKQESTKCVFVTDMKKAVIPETELIFAKT